MELEVIAGLLTGPAAGLAVSIFFLIKFMKYNEQVTNRLIDEMKQDREQNREAIEKIDRRLVVLETLMQTVLAKDCDS